MLTPLFVFNVLLVVIFQEVDALDCWYCASTTDGRCGNYTHFDDREGLKKTCSETDTYCGTLQVDSANGEWSNIRRDCFYTRDCNVWPGTENAKCKVCQTDLCNTGRNPNPRKCWDCTSSVGGKCGNFTHFTTNRHSKTICDDEQRYCGTLQVGVGYELWSTITRGCFSNRVCDVQTKSNIFCDTCGDDYCNTGVVVDSDPLKCWKCRSEIGGECGDFTHLREENRRSVYCSKGQSYCGTLQVGNGNVKRIIRDCFRTQECGLNGKGLCKTCQEDHCNSGRVVTVHFFIKMLIVSIFLSIVSRVE